MSSWLVGSVSMGDDVARLRLHVRVDLLGIDLAVVGRRCIRLDFIDVIGS